jgi:membrane protein implicated in regulation of membrane protease activity
VANTYRWRVQIAITSAFGVILLGIAIFTLVLANFLPPRFLVDSVSLIWGAIFTAFLAVYFVSRGRRASRTLEGPAKVRRVIITIITLNAAYWICLTIWVPFSQAFEFNLMIDGVYISIVSSISLILLRIVLRSNLTHDEKYDIRSQS